MPINSYVNITLIPEPVAPKHLVTREFVENLLSGKIKAPVRVVATTDQAGTYVAAPDLEFTYTATAELEIDGITLAVGDRVLLAAQTNGTENGIYTVEDAGSPTTQALLKRATDFDEDAKISQGVSISVIEGDTHANSTFRLITGGTITLDSTALEFLEVAPATGAAKFAETITGDAVKTSFDVTHNLGTTDVTVQVFNESSKAVVLTDIVVTDGNEVAIGFAEAPTASDVFRVVVVG